MFWLRNRGEEPGERFSRVSSGHREGEYRGLSLALQGLPHASSGRKGVALGGRGSGRADRPPQALCLTLPPESGVVGWVLQQQQDLVCIRTPLGSGGSKW